MYRMHAIGKFISNFRDFYNEINAATLTGAIDVIVVEQPDGSFTCSPFHVRFGKLGVLRSREKVVDIEINGEPLDIHMKLGESGEAFFVEEVGPGELGEHEFIPPHLACSPIPQDDGFLSRFHDHLTDEKPDEPLTITELSGTNEDVDAEAPQFVLEDIETPQITPKVPDIHQSVPKTFHAETLDDDKSNEKVRKISIVNGEFRPISAEVEQEPESLTADSVIVQSTGELPVEEPSSIPGRRDSCKENTLSVDNSLRPNNNNSGKRKKRRKSMKRKAGQKKNNNNGGSSSQTEQSELSESGSGVNRDFAPKDMIKESESGTSIEVAEPAVSEHAVGPTITVTIAESTVTTCELKTTSVENLMELSRIQHASTETDFHFFSDTEITPGCTPPDSRPCSPVQSDTEFEMSRHSKAVGTEDDDDHNKSIHGQLQQSWRWGELPSPPPRQLLSAQTPRGSAKKETVQAETLSSSDEEASKQQQEAAAAAEAAAQRSMLSGMFSFMKKTKRIRHNPESEGIYLSDLNADELDPEVAALYFPTSYRQQSQASQHGQGMADGLQDEEDAESGNGTSLPQSPHSVEGAIGGPKSLDSDFEEPKHSVFERKSYGEISMSLCGGLSGAGGPNEDAFLQSLVTYNDLVQDPKLIENPNLVVRLNGKYLNWRTACPVVMSLVIFQKSLPQEVVDTLSNEYMSLKKVTEKKDVKYSGYSSWFSWRRTSEPKKILRDGQSEEELTSSPDSDKLGDQKQPQTPDTPLSDIAETEIGTEEQAKPVLKGMGSIEEEIQKATGYVDSSHETKEVQGDDSGVATQTNFSLVDTHKDSKEEGYSGSNSSEESDGGRSKTKGIKIPKERRSYYEGIEKYRKTLRLSSDQIACLNLKEGGNEVVFSVTTAYQGTTRCKCHIYKWRFDDKVVISDIDGTITKSDVLGHILPIVGKDWAQSGVAQLFTKIKNNGYRLLYLSARAIGQAHVTREYLKSIKQGDLSLPDGPLLLNPTSLISAFHREVIEKKPEEFKISCLRDIQALFPDDTKPFYAGYGNRINDVWAYRAVGIPIFRIFTINHRGELKHELTQTFQSSYSNMSYIVDQMFPPPPEDTSEDFSNFIYWRDPIPDIMEELQIMNDCSVVAPIVETITAAQ